MTFSATVTLPKVLEYNGVKTPVEELDAEQRDRLVAYLLAYGYGKSLQDSVAGVKKDLESKKVEKEEIESQIRDTMAERAGAILDGTLGLRGPRLSGPDAVRRDVIDEMLRAWLVANNKKLPRAKKDDSKEAKEKIAESVKAFREKFATKFADKIAAEVESRLAKAKDLAGELGEDEDLDLDI